MTSQKNAGIKRINQYIIKQTLGTGSYGKVKLCMNQKNKKVFAMKIIAKNNLKRRTTKDENQGHNNRKTVKGIIDNEVDEMI